METEAEHAQNISETSNNETFLRTISFRFSLQKLRECALARAFRLQKFNAFKTNSKTSSHSIVWIKKKKAKQKQKNGWRMRVRLTK